MRGVRGIGFQRGSKSSPYRISKSTLGGCGTSYNNSYSTTGTLLEQIFLGVGLVSLMSFIFIFPLAVALFFFSLFI